MSIYFRCGYGSGNGYHSRNLSDSFPTNHPVYTCGAVSLETKDTLNEEKSCRILQPFWTTTSNGAKYSSTPHEALWSSLSEIDMLNILAFCCRVISIAEYPEVADIVPDREDEFGCAKIWQHCWEIGLVHGSSVMMGSLTILASYPGKVRCRFWARKRALFRALKTKAIRRRYVIFHPGVIHEFGTSYASQYGSLPFVIYYGRAGPKYKGRISRSWQINVRSPHG